LDWSIAGSPQPEFSGGTLIILKNSIEVLNETIDSTTPSKSGVITYINGDSFNFKQVTTNSSGGTLSIDHQRSGTPSASIPTLPETQFVTTGNSFQSTSTATLGAFDSTVAFTSISTVAVNGSVTVNYADAGNQSFYSIITDQSGTQVFLAVSDPIDNGTTAVNFIVGDQYEIETYYEATQPGPQRTITQSGSGAGMSPFADSLTGNVNTLIGPNTSTFTPTTDSSAIIISINQN
jgi:hypothetical protein